MTAYLRTLFWIGIVMLFLPYFGIPDSVKIIMAVVIGAALVALSFAIRKEYKIVRLRLKRAEQPAVETEINIHE